MPDNALTSDNAADAELAGRQSLIFLLGGAGHVTDAGTPWSRATIVAPNHAPAIMLRGCRGAAKKMACEPSDMTSHAKSDEPYRADLAC
jgi:hypothetical protein